MSTLQITGGTVLRPDMTAREADVLADRETGRIVEIGDTAAGEETLDASGCLVVPGLVNPHCHVAMTLLRGYADDKPLDAWLREDIWPVEAALEPGDIEAGTRLGAVELLKNGVTAIGDMYFEMPTVADVLGEAGLRARIGHGIVTVGKDDADARADFEEGLAVARDLDGAADGRIRTALMPHSLTTADADLVEEFVPRARDAGVPLHYHANETREEVEPIVEDHGVRPLEYADDLGMLEDGDFIAHGVHVDRTEIELLADRDVGVAHCPASNMKLASGIAPVQTMLDAGVTVGIGTDGAASNNDLDPFDELRDAAMVGKLGADDAAALAAPEVVRAATEGGAELLGFDAGRIEEGALADLAVVDFEKPHLTPAHDPVSHLAYAVRGSDVEHTVVGGEVVVRNRRVQTLDEAAVRREAEAHAEALIRRAEGN
ncbi:amidohydrolase [Natronomonas sp. F2-12]|jgi:5-methylthioadenosine/S-adenosylhomocysteine deaminase|uniref:5-methylthioadenosine/S-adenosylhomocysteine deaminase n=1 Tax=Natronomonas aquatica TaxID=2841590 RepID=A0A9R1D357_9EURY|nr:amidohydrolase [Natronomonas aquatica]MCQ4331979.1 amidohydrolase [Natronomonas aquatica]